MQSKEGQKLKLPLFSPIPTHDRLGNTRLFVLYCFAFPAIRNPSLPLENFLFPFGRRPPARYFSVAISYFYRGSFFLAPNQQGLTPALSSRRLLFPAQSLAACCRRIASADALGVPISFYHGESKGRRAAKALQFLRLFRPFTLLAGIIFD